MAELRLWNLMRRLQPALRQLERDFVMEKSQETFTADAAGVDKHVITYRHRLFTHQLLHYLSCSCKPKQHIPREWPDLLSTESRTNTDSEIFLESRNKWEMSSL